MVLAGMGAPVWQVLPLALLWRPPSGQPLTLSSLRAFLSLLLWRLHHVFCLAAHPPAAPSSVPVLWSSLSPPSPSAPSGFFWHARGLLLAGIGRSRVSAARDGGAEARAGLPRQVSAGAGWPPPICRHRWGPRTRLEVEMLARGTGVAWALWEGLRGAVTPPRSSDVQDALLTV